MKKITTMITAALIVVLGLVAVPSVAQAHTGDLIVTSVCNTQTGQYDLTATLKTANTNLTGETRWRVGNTNFQGTPNNANGMDRGPLTTQGSQTVTLGVINLPGNTTGYGPWVYAFTKWSDNYKVGSDGQLTKKLDGKCVKPTVPPQPEDKVDYTAWVDGTWGCGDVSVEQTRTKSVITYVWDATAWKWVAQAPVVTTETHERDLTGDELLSWQTADPEGDCFNRPDQPEPKQGFEPRESEPVCVQPLNGTATVTTEERAWTQEYVWNETAKAWELDEPVYGDWEVVSSITVDAEQCEPLVVPQPDPLNGTEERTNDPTCIVPLNGKASVTTQERTWTQDWDIWNDESQKWELGEKTYDAWKTVSIQVVKDDNCEPVVVDKPKDEPKKTTRVVDSLAVTGSENWGITAITGGAVVLLLAGGVLLYRRARTKK